MQAHAPGWVRWWFRIAAIYGVVVLAPLYLTPPPASAATLAHYGFVGVALAFQLVFWIVARDPVRFRPLMLAGVAEKAALLVPLAIGPADMPRVALPFIAIDAVLGIGFALAWRATPARGSLA